MSRPSDCDDAFGLLAAVDRLATARNGLLASRSRLHAMTDRWPVIGRAEDDLLLPMKLEVKRWEDALDDAMCGVLLAKSSMDAEEARVESETAEMNAECRETLVVG